MIPQSDILHAVSREVLAALPGWTVYENNVPQNFTRPAAAVDFISQKTGKNGERGIRREIVYSVTLMDVLDGYRNGKADALQEAADKVSLRFAGGKLFVGDRALNVTYDISTDGEDGFIDLILDFYDDVGADENENLPLIMEIHHRIR